MIELHIMTTVKSYSPRDEWRRSDYHRKHFANMTEAREWLRDTYGHSKRAPMYRDTPNGPPIKIGYVIGFRASGWGSSSQENWLQQDWVEFRECKTLDMGRAAHA